MFIIMDQFSVLTFLLICSTSFSANIPSQAKLEKAINLTGNTKSPAGIANIIGGANATLGQFPYIVSIQKNASNGWEHYCGGSIISFRFILTAAHCLYSRYPQRIPASSFLILAGTNNLCEGGTKYLVINTTPNSEYNYKNKTNDIGLIKTASSIVFNRLTLPVAIFPFWVGSGAPVTVSGWGKTSWDSDISTTLKYLNTRTGNCSEPYTQICTINPSEQGACNGDSGSPLVITGTNFLVGMVSYGPAGCFETSPNFYTRIIPYLFWILQNMS